MWGEEKGFQECGEERRPRHHWGAAQKESSVLLLGCGRREAMYDCLVLEPGGEGAMHCEWDLWRLRFTSSGGGSSRELKLRIRG